ncbi:hypothetical protein IT403_00085 [Candidatus Nomurabacteria bacterium]|nr:hypothetical protein [Candidatus Nomurabacteria bacterium]
MNNFEKPQASKIEITEEIQKKAIRDADKALSGNPSQNYQLGSLTEKDFNYIEQVEKKAQEKLQNPEYLKEIYEGIKKERNPGKSMGITATDELYDRTILKNYNDEKYGKDNKAA